LKGEKTEKKNKERPEFGACVDGDGWRNGLQNIPIGTQTTDAKGEPTKTGNSFTQTIENG